MDRLLRLGGGLQALSQGTTPSDTPVPDTAEQVSASGALLLCVCLQAGVLCSLLSSLIG